MYSPDSCIYDLPDRQSAEVMAQEKAHRNLIFNALAFILGFTIIFVLMEQQPPDLVHYY